MGLDIHVAGPEAEDQETDQGDVLARIDFEAFHQRFGPQRPDDFSPLVGDLGPGLLWRRRFVVVAFRTGASLAARNFRAVGR